MKVDKPWGYELRWARTDRYVGKVIHVDAGHALSLQYHNVKDETLLVWRGRMLFEIEEGGQQVLDATTVHPIGFSWRTWWSRTLARLSRLITVPSLI